MKDKIETNIRKWISLIIAVLIYYVIHEGSHLLVALSYGVFKKIKLSTVGVQIVINDATDIEKIEHYRKIIEGSHETVEKNMDYFRKLSPQYGKSIRDNNS